MILPIYNYALAAQISTNTSVSAVPSVVDAIIVSSHTNGTVKLWDSLTASGTVALNTYTYSAGSSVILLGIKFNTGVYVDMGGTTQQISVLWNAFIGG